MRRRRVPERAVRTAALEVPNERICQSVNDLIPQQPYSMDPFRRPRSKSPKPETSPLPPRSPINPSFQRYNNASFSYSSEPESAFLSPDKLRKQIKLDNTFNIPMRPGSNLGTISSKLPPELVSQILLELDIISITTLRRVNTYSRSLVDLLREYRQVYTHAPDVLRGMLATGAGRFHTIRKLHTTLIDGNCKHHSRANWASSRRRDDSKHDGSTTAEELIPPSAFERLHVRCCRAKQSGKYCMYCNELRSREEKEGYVPRIQSADVLAPQIYLPSCQRICDECFTVNCDRQEVIEQGYLLLTSSEISKYFRLEPEDITALRPVILRLNLQIGSAPQYKNFYDTVSARIEHGQPLYRSEDVRQLALERFGEEPEIVTGSNEIDEECQWVIRRNCMESRALDNFVVRVPVLDPKTGEVEVGLGCKACQMGHQFFAYDIMLKSIETGRYQPFVPLVYSRQDLEVHLDNCILKREVLETLKRWETEDDKGDERLKAKVTLFEKMLDDEHFIRRFPDEYQTFLNGLFDGFREVIAP